MSTLRLPQVFCVIVSLILMAPSVFGQFGGLTSRVPRGANTLVILNVERLLRSPLAQKQNWRGEHEKAHAAGVTVLPPAAKHFVMAAKMDFEFMTPIWEVALADVSYEPSMVKVAARWGGQVDHIAGRTAALLPDDSYVIELGPNKVAAMRPASRQNVSRWLRDTNNVSVNSENLSEYLVTARTYADKNGTPIIMAMDLHDVISEQMVLNKAKAFDSLGGVDINKVAKAISRIRGLTLGITVKDSVGGAIIVDFYDDVSFLKDIAKPLLLNVLTSNSAMIDEFEGWKATTEGKRIRIGGPLYRSGLQRILSVLDVPGSLQQSMPSAEETADPENMTRVASQAYFKSVTGLLDDLKEKPRDTKVKTAGQVGLWYGRYAKKIDNLPVLNVDPELLDYGAFVAAAMRHAEDSLRNVGGRTRVRQLNAPAQYRSVGRYGSYGNYGGWGGGYYGYRGAWLESPRLEAQNRARIATEERVKGADSARAIAQDINNATAEVRRKMTQKYNAEF